MNAFIRRVWSVAILATGSAVMAGCVSASIRPGPAVYADPPGKAKAKTKASVPPDLEELRDRILEAHNQIRAEARVHSLSVSKRLQAAAQGHAMDMAAHRKMSHKGSKGSTLADRVEAKGYSFRRVGENVAYGRYPVDRVMKGWMDSPPHKRNILGGFSQIGVGCAIDEDGKRYWCVNFGLPAGQ